jgi:hypothetical protein
MNNDEAKFLLIACRPGGQDAADPSMAEALGQAGRDPILSAWHARERAFDRAVADKVATVIPPPGLRATILAGGRVTSRRAWWTRPEWIALAACLVIAAVTASFFSNRTPHPLQDFAQLAMVDTIRGHHDGHGPMNDAMQARLADPGMHLSAGLPVDFASMKASGCRMLDFGGKQVLEICFVRSGTQFHVYIARRSDMPLRSDWVGHPEFASVSGAQAVSWSDERYAYTVTEAGPADPDTLRSLL